jgi:hypothetical protein
MKGTDLFEAVGYVGDDLIREAVETLPVRQRHVRRYLALAACLCLAVGLGWTAQRTSLRWLSGYFTVGSNRTSGDTYDSWSGEGYIGHDEGSTFMSYAGPVFPLTTETEQDALTAERSIKLDFGADQAESSTGCAVTDAYTLTNEEEAERTVTMLYPFVGTLRELTAPTVTVDGETVAATLCTGGYSGGFTGASGEDDGRFNLAEADSWEAYQALLSDGSYQASALAEAPSLDTPVTLYELVDNADGETTTGADTVAISFTIDPEQTTILTYGINGMTAYDTGEQQYSYFVKESNPHYLLVLGDDLGDYTVQGYTNGACETELDGLTATVTRTETTLGAILMQLAGREVQRNNAACTADQLYRATAELLTNYCLLSDAERYETGRLEELFADALGTDRVLYLRFDVTLPAAGSVRVTASLTKRASYDFDCSGSGNTGVNGYDLVTQLGSSLHFTSQSATIASADAIEIVRQNFGFDLDGGVTTVELDPTEEHYYLEIRRK